MFVVVNIEEQESDFWPPKFPTHPINRVPQKPGYVFGWVLNEGFVWVKEDSYEDINEDETPT